MMWSLFNKFTSSLILFILISLIFFSCSSRQVFVPYEERNGIIRDYDIMTNGRYLDWFYIDRDRFSPNADIHIPDLALIGESESGLYDSELRRIDINIILADLIGNELKEKGLFSSVLRQTEKYPCDAEYILIGAIIGIDAWDTQILSGNPIIGSQNYTVEIEIIALPDRNTVISARHNDRIRDNKKDHLLRGFRSVAGLIAREIYRNFE